MFKNHSNMEYLSFATRKKLQKNTKKRAQVGISITIRNHFFMLS